MTIPPTHSATTVNGPTGEQRSVLPPNAVVEESAPLGADGATMSLMCVPTSDGDLPVAVRHWVDDDRSLTGRAAMWTAFQGAHVYWSSDRCAILAPKERLDSLRRVILEATRHERELQSIEHGVAEYWPMIESDALLAFAFNEKSIARQRELQARLQHALVLRARLARIAPYLLAPLEHPPTLASQVAERMRERLCTASRYEALGGQLDTIRDTYDMCAQRASDFLIARTGHRLEWVIIILLAAQLLLWTFEYLTATNL